MERNLVHGPGDVLGQPFRLPAYLRRFIYRLYEYDAVTRRRIVRRALLGVPKGNMKTELMAAVGLVELAGPVAPPSPEVRIAAASFEQADILFGTARVMIEEGPLRGYFDCWDTEILIKGQSGVLKRVAAAAGTTDGGRTTCFIADEVHEWTGARERVHLVNSNSLAKRAFGLELNISTAGFEKDSLLGRMYDYGRRVSDRELEDPSFLFEWWEAAEHWNINDPEQLMSAILEANPATDDYINPDNILARYHDPNVPEHEFRRYYLNQWVSSPEAWLSSDQWRACAGATLPSDRAEVVLGFDGSYARDATAIVGCWSGGLFVVRIWERDTRDPDWTVPRSEVDAVVSQSMKRWRVREFACDPPGWQTEIESWEKEFGRAVVRFETNVPARMAPACDRLYTAVVSGKLRHDGNPTLARHVSNCHTRETRFGRVITKDHKDSPRKIDSAVAAVIAWERWSDAPRRKLVAFAA